MDTPCDPTVTDCPIEDGATLRFAASAQSASASTGTGERTTDKRTTDDAAIPDAALAPDDAGASDADALHATTTTDPAGAGVADLAELVKATGGDSTLTVILALIAVVGGAAGWKFFSQLADQRHEQSMKRLDIEAQSAGIGKAQPQACAVRHAELVAQMDALSAKIESVCAQADALAKKTASFDADTDVGDLERQVKRLSKTVKALQASPD